MSAGSSLSGQEFSSAMTVRGYASGQDQAIKAMTATTDAPVVKPPLPLKPSTFGSVQQATAWTTPENVSHSAKSMGTTLFDEPSTPFEAPRTGN
jgi:hypothetical protein